MLDAVAGMLEGANLELLTADSQLLVTLQLTDPGAGVDGELEFKAADGVAVLTGEAKFGRVVAAGGTEVFSFDVGDESSDATFKLTPTLIHAGTPVRLNSFRLGDAVKLSLLAMFGAVYCARVGLFRYTPGPGFPNLGYSFPPAKKSPRRTGARRLQRLRTRPAYALGSILPREPSPMSKPLALSDSELDAVMSAARPLDVRMRDPFLHAVAHELAARSAPVSCIKSAASSSASS